LKADDFVPSAASSDKNSMVSGRAIGSKFPIKRALLTILLIITLVIPAVLILKTVATRPDTKDINLKQSIKICNDDTLRQADNHIKTDNTIALGQLVKKIEQNSKYIEDPNCLYVTTIYYILVIDVPKAKKNYDNLQDTYDPGKGYSDKLGPFTKDLKSLESEIKRIEAVAEEFKKNSFFGPEVER
jgi:hypothetical protein